MPVARGVRLEAGVEEWSFTIPGRPLIVNAERRMHHMERHEQVAQARHDAFFLVRQAKIPACEWVEVEVIQLCRAGPKMPDTGACYPSAKAAIDGMVDAKVIPDDTGEFMHGIMMRPPERSEEPAFDGVLIVVRGVPA